MNLSPMDKMLYVLDRNETPYSTIFAIRINKEINLLLFKEACECVWNKYSILQSVIYQNGEELRIKPSSFLISKYYFQLTLNDSDLATCYTKLIETPFNPLMDPLCYIYLVQITPDKYQIIFKWLHALFDGISALIILKTVLSTYIAKQKNEEPFYPILERLTVAELIKRNKYLRNGEKIPSGLILNLTALKEFFSIAKMKIMKSYVGPFNRGDYTKGEYQYSYVKLPSRAILTLNSVKTRFNATKNDILMANIIKGFHGWTKKDDYQKVRIILPRNIRPENERTTLGNLIVPFYLTIKTKYLSPDDMLFKTIKKLMDEKKKELGPIANQYFFEHRKIALLRYKHQAQTNFKIATLQISNVGSINRIFGEDLISQLNIVDADFLVGIKPGLLGILTLLELNDEIKIGLTYTDSSLTHEDTDTFLERVFLNF